MGKVYFEPPVLAIVTGVPASGKSTLINGVYDRRGKKLKPGLVDRVTYMPLLDKDVVKAAFQRSQHPRVREATYTLIEEIVTMTPPRGSLLIDSTYAGEVQNPQWADPYQTHAASKGIKFKLVRCVAPEEVIKARIMKCRRPCDAWKYADEESWARYMEEEPIHVHLPHGGIEIDTTQPHEENIERVLAFFAN